MKDTYTKKIKVSPEDIDELNHVNNVRYIRWIQDISTEHWFSATKNKLSKKYIWVVASHFVEYKRPSFLNEELIIETYVEKFEGTISERIVTIKNGNTQKINVKATTRWCLIDPDTNKPLRVPYEILEIGF